MENSKQKEFEAILEEIYEPRDHWTLPICVEKLTTLKTVLKVATAAYNLGVRDSAEQVNLVVSPVETGILWHHDEVQEHVQIDKDSILKLEIK